MAVRRAGIGKARPTKRTLGRVLVTIDDLEALHQQLKGNDATTSVDFEFTGGDFDSPMDLEDLSPNERQRIVVKTSDVQVILSAFEGAYAVGPPDSVESVYQEWAQNRQTKLKPDGWRHYLSPGFPGFVSLSAAVALTAFMYFTSHERKNALIALSCIWVALLVIASLFAVFLLSSVTHAVVVPMRNKEFWLHQAEGRRTRNAVWATIGVGVLSVLATIIVGMITLK
jgi:hypothetical protein